MGSGDLRRNREYWIAFKVAGLRVEAACRGVEAGTSGGAKGQRIGRRFSRVSKEQARNVNLGMVVRRTNSRSERAKGRYERPAPDRKYEQADLQALIRYRRKAVAGSKQGSVLETCLQRLGAVHAGGERSCESGHLEPFFFGAVRPRLPSVLPPGC